MVVITTLNVAPWLQETFEPSLLMSVLLVGLGSSISWYEGYFSISLSLLVLVAAVLIQNAANVLNDYYDFVKGVDQITEKTPFSGGSKLLVQGILNAESVRLYGIASLTAAAVIGLYLSIVRSFLIIPLVIDAVLVTYAYTPFLARHYLGEIFAGLNLGPLTVLGTYLVLTTKFSSLPLLYGIMPGMMIANVLLMNEIPDTDADFKAGRRNLATLLGRRKTSWLVLFIGLAAYAWTTFAAFANILPTPCVIADISMPVFLKGALGGLRKNESAREISQSLGMNIIAMILSLILLGVSLPLSRLL